MRKPEGAKGGGWGNAQCTMLNDEWGMGNGGEGAAPSAPGRGLEGKHKRTKRGGKRRENAGEVSPGER